MTGDLTGLWVYLQASPLLWLTATLLAYVAAQALFERVGRFPLLNPVLLAGVLLIAVLTVTGTPYQTYFDGAQFVHFLLGPATVALAIPLARTFPAVRRSIVPLLLALAAGSVTAIVAAVGIAAALGASPETLLSLAPKSVTTPIAMAVAEQTGGLPSLTAALVILTGIVGAVVGPPLCGRLGISDPRALGTALGTAAHGIGTARAFQAGPLAGTFAAVSLALNGLLTALLLPLLARTF